MTLDFAARLSGYLTLALATACLVCADAAFLPELPWLWPLVLVILGFAFVAEGRGWVMPAWVANLLGFIITAGVVASVVFFVLDTPEVPGDDRPLALLLLPYVGPILVVLMLVKLFRPKTVTDLWVLQGLGLLMTGLACVLADGGLFGVLLLAYLVCGAWHLGLAYLRREELRARAGQAARGTVPWLALGMLRGLRWMLAAGLLALPAFLLSPRIGDETWNPLVLAGTLGGGAVTRASVGMADGIDLNRTETLDPADEEALRVEAFQDRDLTQPKTDLSLNQRWRGVTLASYENGRWQSGHTLPVQSSPLDWGVLGQPGKPLTSAAPTRHLPDLGPGQFYLRYTVFPRKAGGLVLAEPVAVQRRVQPVVAEPVETRFRPLFQEAFGILLPIPQPHDRSEVRYRQVVPPVRDPNLSEPVQVSQRYAVQISQQPVMSLGVWTRNLLGRLAEQPGSDLRATDLEPVPTLEGLTGPRDPEAVARALAHYLASSGAYSYSFEQSRSDTLLDPTLDFLLNVRRGPCTRFASALALMLRSLGMPARVVLGFRGCEPLGDGQYRVLTSQAHAWVEALVSKSGPDGAARWHWLTLDPTPSAEEVPRPSFSLVRWWEKQGDESAALWRDYIVDYNPNMQRNVVEAMGDRLVGTEASLTRPLSPNQLLAAAAALGGVGLGVVGFVRRRRKRLARVRAFRVPFYARLLDVLARRHGLQPRSGQTPREFAVEAGRALGAKGDTAGVAEVPARLAELFYRVAYGGRPLADGEAREVQAQLDALATAR
jgi:transglutaminase-like putative cysteine protease